MMWIHINPHVSPLWCVVVCVYMTAVCVQGYTVYQHDTQSDLPADSVCGQYSHAAVATDVPVCSQVGSTFLQDGGSIVDAAIGTMLCLAVAHPHSSGIGGGVSVVYYDNSGDSPSIVALNSREVAPSYAHRDMFVDDPDAQHTGGLSIGLMGELKAAHELWVQYGALPWESLFTPAIDLARNGINVTWALADAIETEREAIVRDPGLRSHFMSDGQFLEEGDMLYQTALADSLQLIGEEGWTTFYNGSLAEAIVADIQDQGGILTVEEMGNFTIQWSLPEVTSLQNGGYTIYGVPLPVSSIGQGFYMKLMDRYNLSPPSNNSTDEETLLYHRMSEALKFAIGRTMVFGDDSPQFLTPEMQALIDLMRNDSYVDTIWERILDNSVYELEEYMWDPSMKPDNLPPSGSTTHFGIMTDSGDAISVTNTVGAFFGCKILGVRTGIVFNNGMYNFYTPEMTDLPWNYIEPGKRPRSYVCPQIVTDDSGRAVMTVGGSGSMRIFSGATQVMTRSLWLTTDDLKAVADAGRVHNEMDDTIQYYDVTIDEEILSGLSDKGHILAPVSERFPYTGVVQSTRLVELVEQDESGARQHGATGGSASVRYQACSDYRKQGAPDGY